MVRSRFTLRGAVNLALAIGVMATLIAGGLDLAGGAHAARADVLPRYKLQVGQQLLYKTAKTDASEDKYPIEWTIRVIAENPDKSWRVVFTQQAYGRTNVGYFDLAADGRLVENATIGPFTNPTLLFPPLPPDAASLLSTWSAELGLDNTKRRFKSSDPPAGVTWTFTEKPETVFDPVYLIDTERQYTFDLEKALVTEVTSTSTQGWPEGRSADPYVQHIVLDGSTMLEGVDLAELGRQYDAFFAAQRSYDELMSRAQQEFGSAAELMDEAEAGLTEAIAGLTLPLVREVAETKLKQHEDLEKYALQQAEKFGKLLGQPSPDWKTTDLDDQPRSLGDYRGKVVLLDFWYRGCGWCIRAMPQINQLAGDFDGQPVAVLGMNNDRKLEDARFVIEKMGLNYPSLKNGDGEEGINTHYNVSGWPTLVMLDREGVVRHIHVGYSPTLREELGKKIRELLAE